MKLRRSQGPRIFLLVAFPSIKAPVPPSFVFPPFVFWSSPCYSGERFRVQGGQTLQVSGFVLPGFTLGAGASVPKSSFVLLLKPTTLEP